MSEQDQMDIIRQTTNITANWMLLDEGLVALVKSAADGRTMAGVLDAWMEAHGASSPSNSLLGDYASVAKLYIDWDIVVSRLCGREVRL